MSFKTNKPYLFLNQKFNNIIALYITMFVTLYFSLFYNNINYQNFNNNTLYILYNLNNIIYYLYEKNVLQLPS